MYAKRRRQLREVGRNPNKFRPREKERRKKYIGDELNRTRFAYFLMNGKY